MSYQHKYVDGTKVHFPLGKVVCIGRNYAEHAKELDNPVPTDRCCSSSPAAASSSSKAGSAFRRIAVRCITKPKSWC